MPDETEKVEFNLRKDLADQLPPEKEEKNVFLTRAVEREFALKKHVRKAGKAKSEKKTAAARENAKKGGWPKGRSRKQPE